MLFQEENAKTFLLPVSLFLAGVLITIDNKYFAAAAVLIYTLMVLRIVHSGARKTKDEGSLGCVLWFTGLSGSGKSTLAEIVCRKLRERGLQIEHLDGDKVREVFPQTGFDEKSRNEHIRRVGFLASKLERHGVCVVASFISPYRESRDFTRSQCRNFIEIHLNTPLAVCQKRDPKGLYRKVAEGKISHFTGVDDPYEIPASPELVLDTSILSIDECVSLILQYVQSCPCLGKAD